MICGGFDTPPNDMKYNHSSFLTLCTFIIFHSFTHASMPATISTQTTLPNYSALCESNQSVCLLLTNYVLILFAGSTRLKLL